MMWRLSHRADPLAKVLADRHYNRQKPDTPQFVPPGRCIVLYGHPPAKAFWITSAPFGQYVKHRWPGAWVCSAFRSEGSGLASDMIREALACSCFLLGDPPPLGLVTFIDRKQVRPIPVRGVSTWGRTWLLAGFEPDGETKGGLLAFRITPDRMPEPSAPLVCNDMERIYRRILEKRNAPAV